MIIWLTGTNPNRLSSERASVPFTWFFVVYMGRACSLEKLSSEWAVEWKVQDRNKHCSQFPAEKWHSCLRHAFQQERRINWYFQQKVLMGLCLRTLRGLLADLYWYLLIDDTREANFLQNCERLTQGFCSRTKWLLTDGCEQVVPDRHTCPEPRGFSLLANLEVFHFKGFSFDGNQPLLRRCRVLNTPVYSVRSCSCYIHMSQV